MARVDHPNASALGLDQDRRDVASDQREEVLDPSRLEARAAVLYDVGSGRVLYQKNANEALPLASLTKLMAAQTVLSRKDPTTPVLITKDDVRSEGDSGLQVGETMPLGDLISLALVASSNDAITAAASALGADPIEKMNAAARELGLTQTHFNNPTGLDVSASVSGAYGSCFDVARLASLFYTNYPEFFELTTLPDVRVDGGAKKKITLPATTLPLQNIPGFVAAKKAHRKGAKVRATNFSGERQFKTQDFTRDLDKIYEVLVTHYNGGTVFPTSTLLDGDDPKQVLIVTDTFLGNEGQTSEAVTNLRKRHSGNRVTVYEIHSGQHGTYLRNAGAEVIQGTTTDIFKRVIGKAEEVYVK